MDYDARVVIVPRCDGRQSSVPYNAIVLHVSTCWCNVSHDRATKTWVFNDTNNAYIVEIV